MDSSSLKDQTLSDRFKLLKKLGTGSFGSVWEALDLKNNNKIVAIKIEKSNKENKHLEIEGKIYLMLQNNSSFHGQAIPKILYFGQSNSLNYMVLEKVGKNLETLFQENKEKFSLKTIYMIGIQLIKRAQFLHSRGFIHRDIKPTNFAIGNNSYDKHRIYMIDLGLVMKYVTSSENHIPEMRGKKVVGTIRYASLNTHRGINQSRRDDIEAIGYILLYFMIQKLPWMNLQSKNRGNNKEDISKVIMEKKGGLDFDKMEREKPELFPIIYLIREARNLRFESEPKYQNYTAKLLEGIAKIGEEYDLIFDWMGD